jgi:hypothetical protein
MQRDEQAMHWVDAEALARVQGEQLRPAPTVKQRIVAAVRVAASGAWAGGQAQGNLMYPIRSLASEKLLQDRAEIVLQIAALELLALVPPEVMARISQRVEEALETHPTRYVPRDGSPLSLRRSGPQAPQGSGS